MPTTPLKILIIGDGAVGTGFARIIHGIFLNIPKNEYLIYHLAVNYKGDPHNLPWKVYTAMSGGDTYGFNRTDQLLDISKPDIVFCLNDLWILGEYIQIFKKSSVKPKIVFYYSLDAGPVDPDWIKDHEIVSRSVTFTEYAKKEVGKVVGEERIQVIPPGLDFKTFFPFPSGNGIIDAKRRLGVFKEEELKNSFLVLNANRNQPRKRIDITIKGFSLFAKGKPDNVKIYLHMGFEDHGWDILKLSTRYGIFDRLCCSSNKNSIPGIEDEAMNLVFNACDAGVNTSYFEGWGLPNYEHASTRRAQVIPRINAASEIWGDVPIYLEPITSFTQEHTLSEGQIVSPESLAEALERLYTDIELRNKVAEACYKRTTRPENSWENIGKRWHQLFQEVANSS